MAAYNTGSVSVTVGSAHVIGNGTDFTANIGTGYCFKLRNYRTWYEVASVNTATHLVLTSRYSDNAYIVSRNPENLASVVAASTEYSGTVSYYPVIQNSFVINASLEKFSDNGGGVLTGDGSPAGSGTIDYDTGAWTVSLGTNIDATANMTASYFSGGSITSAPYMIVTQYTAHYLFPEMGLNDINFQYIYTKAMRKVDAALRNLVNLTVTASEDITVNATPYGFVLYSPDGTKHRLKVSNEATLTASVIS